ncbi:hypothetical protein D3C80_509020 [compost metagenome]
MLGVDMCKNPFQIRIDERPRTHVLRLFLTPDDFCLTEARQLIDERLGREWIELFDAQQVDIVDATLFALFIKIVVDLARAQNHATDLAVLLKLDAIALVVLRIIPKQTVERRIARQFVEARHSTLVAQQRLRRHHDERLAEVTLHLTAQDMEVVSRRRNVGHLHVIFRTHLQPAFETC